MARESIRALLNVSANCSPARVLLVLAIVISALLVSARPAAAVDEPTAVEQRSEAVAWLVRGGPNVTRAAEAALVGSDEDVARFLDIGLYEALTQDDQVRIAEFAALGGRAMTAAARAALDGSVDDRRAFLDSGWEAVWTRDERVRLAQVMAAGGPATKAAAQHALNGTDADIAEFLARGQYAARETDGVGAGERAKRPNPIAIHATEGRPCGNASSEPR
jgi:short repeat uncharacterized protein predicted to be involved in signal transduction